MRVDNRRDLVGRSGLQPRVVLAVALACALLPLWAPQAFAQEAGGESSLAVETTTTSPTSTTSTTEPDGTGTTPAPVPTTTTSPAPSPASTTTTARPAPSPKELERKAEEARHRQEEVQRRLARLQELSREVTAKQLEVFRVSLELDVMDEELAAKIEDYNLAVLDLEEARAEAERMERELAATQTELIAASELLESRLVAVYKSDLSALDVLLNTSDMADFVTRVSLLLSIARSDQARVDEVESLRARASRLLDELSRTIFRVTLASTRLEAEKTVIEEKLAERREYVETLSAEIRGLVDEQREIGMNAVPATFDLGAVMAGDSSDVVKTALRYLGVPYVWGGATPAGFDCSGLVQYVFGQHGISVPHYSRYQALMGVEVPLDALLPGDLVFFGDPVYHVGIAMGDDLFVHAPRTGDVVKISRLSARTDLSHIRRLALFASSGG